MAFDCGSPATLAIIPVPAPPGLEGELLVGRARPRSFSGHSDFEAEFELTSGGAEQTLFHKQESADFSDAETVLPRASVLLEEADADFEDADLEAPRGLPAAELALQPGLPSVGSALHGHRCKPCRFFHAAGCKQGPSCEFCHLCGAGEVEKRKEQKEKARLRSGGQFKQRVRRQTREAFWIWGTGLHCEAAWAATCVSGWTEMEMAGERSLERVLEALKCESEPTEASPRTIASSIAEEVRAPQAAAREPGKGWAAPEPMKIFPSDIASQGVAQRSSEPFAAGQLPARVWCGRR